jgi:hypothetical protein
MDARRTWPRWAARAYCLGLLYQSTNLANRTDPLSIELRAMKATLQGRLQAGETPNPDAFYATN